MRLTKEHATREAPITISAARANTGTCGEDCQYRSASVTARILVEDCREVSGSGAAIDPTGSGQAVDFLTVTVRPVDTGNHAAVNAAIGDIEAHCNRIIGFFDSLGNGDGGG